MSLVEQLQAMLADAKERYQQAAAMHLMSRVSALAARIQTLEDVLKLLTGSTTGETRYDRT